MPLAPEIEEFLKAQAASGAPAVWQAPLSEIRANTQGRMVTSGAVEPIFEISNRFIPGPTADLPIRIYRPTDNPTAPAIVHFHGGGFVLNFLDMYDASMARLANQSGFTIIGVAYQKAPEHPFPIPFDDCYATLLWVRNHAGELKIDVNQIGVAGDSAGAALASAVALKARDEGISLKFQALIYPCNGRDFSTDSYQEFATGYGLTREAMQWFWEQYLQGDSHDSNPYAVPLAASNFASLAPAIIITAEFDPLLSDSLLYAERLRGAGNHVTYKEFKGMIHGFFTNMAVTPTAKEAIDYLAAELKKVITE
jgi:acetyl esterase